MFVQQKAALLVLIIIALTTYLSGATVQALDSIGEMPEINVTAPRCENQDEAWAGLVEGVVVEAQRLPLGTEATIAKVNGENISSNINGGDLIFGGTITSLLGKFTLTLATISILYISIHAYLIAEEVEHERTKNRS